MIDFEQARRAMVDNQLRTNSITDRRLLAAMGQVPRERFVPEGRRGLAYIDREHLLDPGSGRALAAPTPFARLVQLADLRPGDRVMDVGCGSGYSSAVLAALVAEVVAVEEAPGLVALARDNLRALEVGNVFVEEAPLAAGAPKLGPYDAILIEGIVARVPEALQAQLAEGGRLVAVIERAGIGVVHRFVRSGDEVAGRAEFNLPLPPLPAAQGADQFVF